MICQDSDDLVVCLDGFWLGIAQGKPTCTIDGVKDCVIPYDAKLVKTIERIPERLSHAAGSSHLNWQVYFLDAERE